MNTVVNQMLFVKMFEPTNYEIDFNIHILHEPGFIASSIVMMHIFLPSSDIKLINIKYL